VDIKLITRGSYGISHVIIIILNLNLIPMGQHLSSGFRLRFPIEFPIDYIAHMA